MPSHLQIKSYSPELYTEEPRTAETHELFRTSSRTKHTHTHTHITLRTHSHTHTTLHIHTQCLRSIPFCTLTTTSRQPCTAIELGGNINLPVYIKNNKNTIALYNLTSFNGQFLSINGDYLCEHWT